MNDFSWYIKEDVTIFYNNKRAEVYDNGIITTIPFKETFFNDWPSNYDIHDQEVIDAINHLGKHYGFREDD